MVRAAGVVIFLNDGERAARVGLTQSDNQSFGVTGFPGTTRLGRSILEGPLLLPLPPIPGQQRVKLGDGNDFGLPATGSSAPYACVSKKRKKSACFETGSALAEMASICDPLKGVKARAN